MLACLSTSGNDDVGIAPRPGIVGGYLDHTRYSTQTRPTRQGASIANDNACFEHALFTVGQRVRAVFDITVAPEPCVTWNVPTGVITV